MGLIQESRHLQSERGQAVEKLFDDRVDPGDAPGRSQTLPVRRISLDYRFIEMIELRHIKCLW
jgi:hypothetical protein